MVTPSLLGELLQLVSDSLPVGLLIRDERTQMLLYRNQAFLEVWGFEGPEEQKRLDALDGPAMAHECALRVSAERHSQEAWVRACQAHRVGEAVEDEIALRDGRYLRLYSLPLQGEDGAQQWRLCIFEDITVRKQGEALLLIQKDLAQALSAAGDLPALLDAALDAVLRVGEFDCAGIYIVDDATGGLELAAHRGVTPQFAAAVSRYPADAPHTQLVMAGRPAYATYSDVAAAIGATGDPVEVREGPQALAVLPVLHAGRVIACLNAASHTVDQIPAAARGGLEAIAGHIGGAVARAKAEMELRRRERAERRLREQLLALHEAGIDLLRTQSVDDLCRRAVELARERLGFERVGIWFRDNDPEFALGSFGTGEDGSLRDERSQRIRVAPGSPLANVLADRQRIVIGADVPLRDHHGHEIGRGARALAAIWDGQEVIGAIVTDSLFTGRMFSDDDGQVLALLAATIGHIHLRQRMEQMRRRAEELAAADRQKDEFLAMLSHELRNPLGAVTAAIHLVGQQGADRERQGRALEIMERQVGHMGRILDDLLDLSRVATGQIRLRVACVSLQAAVADAVDAVRPQLDERAHALELRLPPEPLLVDADPTRLEQILWNLLANAARYTPPGGRIRIEARRLANRAEVLVMDNGAGIPPEFLERVFEPFVQVGHDGGETQRGLGIGLALVRRLVEMHGGEVRARSAGLGMGSEFAISFPLSSVPLGPEALTDPPVDLPAAAPRRVLLVDDNPDGAEVLGDLIGVWGHEVLIANDGRAALDAAQSWRPDIVLLDLDLPEMDGWEVARHLRQLPGIAQVTLVAVTGHGLDQDRQRAAEAGFDHFLTKPADPLQLHRLVAGVPG